MWLQQDSLFLAVSRFDISLFLNNGNKCYDGACRTLNTQLLKKIKAPSPILLGFFHEVACFLPAKHDGNICKN